MLEAITTYIIHDANDREGRKLVASHDLIELLTERVIGEVAFCEGSVDDGDSGRGCSVIDGEATPLKDGGADDAEVLWRDADVGDGFPLCHWRWRSGRPKGDGSVVNFSERQHTGDSSRLNAGKGLQSRKQIVDEVADEIGRGCGYAIIARTLIARTEENSCAGERIGGVEA